MPDVYQYIISKFNILLRMLPMVLSIFKIFILFLLVMFDTLVQENCTLFVI